MAGTSVYICDVQARWLGWRLCCTSQATGTQRRDYMCSGSQNLRVSIVLKASKSAGAKGDVPKIYKFMHPLLQANSFPANVHHMCYFRSKLSGNFRNLFALLVAQQVSEILPPSLQIFHIMMQCTKPALERSNIISFTQYKNYQYFLSEFLSNVLLPWKCSL